MTHDERQRLLRQLATMTQAGVPLTDAVRTQAEGESGPAARVLASIGHGLRSGESLASAGRRHELFADWESRVLEASAEAGRIEEGLYALADEYARRASFARRLRSRLALPVSVLVLALLLAPITGLAAGEYGLPGYFWHALVPLVLIYALARLVRQWWHSTFNGSSSELLSKIALHLPVVSELVALRGRRNLVHALAMLLRSGVPAHQAVPLAVSAVTNPHLRRRFRMASVHLENGATVSDALGNAGVLPGGPERALTDTGEHAGSLDEMLDRQVRALDRQLDDREQLLAEWLPRVLYFAVITYIASQVIGFYAGYFRDL